MAAVRGAGRSQSDAGWNDNGDVGRDQCAWSKRNGSLCSSDGIQLRVQLGGRTLKSASSRGNPQRRRWAPSIGARILGAIPVTDLHDIAGKLLAGKKAIHDGRKRVPLIQKLNPAGKSTGIWLPAQDSAVKC